MTAPAPLSLERCALYSLNYLERLVDAQGLPYFNIFWTEPAQAAHDWPDFGDVMSRQLQGAIMLRRMTGVEAVTEKVWLRKLLAMIDPADGLLHRPETSFSQACADWGDAALTLYTLATAAIDYGEPALRAATLRMAESLLKRLQAGNYPEQWLGGFAVKSFMVTGRELGSEAALEAARFLVDRYINENRMFTPEDTFGAWGHMHGNLRTLAGAADYALTIGDTPLFERVTRLYRYVKTTGTRFGFLPEVIGRKGDNVACETCALMDFAGTGVTLANHGHPEFWGDMERLARNHLVESQVRDTAWLLPADDGDDNDTVAKLNEDTAQFTWRDLPARILGAWAGWSSPNHILAYRETLNAHWGGPELRDKIRVLQNCCGGSGVHALYILWKNAARYEQGTLSVNLHLDKKLPQAEVRCQQPYRGRLQIQFSQDSALRVRIPDFTSQADVRVTLNGASVSNGQVSDHFLELGRFQAGDLVEVHYPLPAQTETISIGNPGFRQWRYRVSWKGDTVVKLEPIDNEARTGYSDFDKTEVPVYYGAVGPGALYQRSAMLEEVTESQLNQWAAAALHPDDGGLDFWRISH